MSYIYKIGNTQFELTQENKNLWIARNPKLRIWYIASTYDKLCARIEEQYEQFPENFVEMTEQQMLGLKRYCENIEKYELKNRRIEVRVSEREYQKFLDLPGETKSDKFRNLLKGDD